MAHRARSVASAVALVAFAAGAGLALADNGGGTGIHQGKPRTDRANARFVVADGESTARTCQGKDGTYLEVKSHVTGPVTGGPRLRGVAEAEIRDFFNLDTGNGTFRGVLVVRSQSGQTKVEARFIGVDYRVGGEDETAGLIHGEARRAGAFPAGELVANFRVDFPENSPPTVQIGGAWTNNLIPAVIQRGSCTGPFHPVPEAASASSAAARWGAAR
jgi:hypothetical protein